ncbi:hypothetical protein [Alteromonas phage ZP6]|uniref:Uncharacterized protein n=1 Tax=Alteromonas phage ZP6 TaxID=2492447 RepID=A0A3S9U8J1_9CAUD|nr:hypothetical protein PQC03_gp13 [Alteromonas phage ZP6]AZS06563.1 hypothetical protein [Alteromonas phage ZP6]
MATTLAVISAFGSLVSAGKQMKARSDAKRAAEANARAIEAETAEEARRLKLQQQETEASSRAAAAASGSGGVSQDAYQDYLGNEHARELAWLKKSGGSKAGVTRMQGRAAASTATANAFGTLAGGMSSLYGAVG